MARATGGCARVGVRPHPGHRRSRCRRRVSGGNRSRLRDQHPRVKPATDRGWAAGRPGRGASAPAARRHGDDDGLLLVGAVQVAVVPSTISRASSSSMASSSMASSSTSSSSMSSSSSSSSLVLVLVVVPVVVVLVLVVVVPSSSSSSSSSSSRRRHRHRHRRRHRRRWRHRHRPRRGPYPRVPGGKFSGLSTSSVSSLRRPRRRSSPPPSP